MKLVPVNDITGIFLEICFTLLVGSCAVLAVTAAIVAVVGVATYLL